MHPTVGALGGPDVDIDEAHGARASAHPGLHHPRPRTPAHAVLRQVSYLIRQNPLSMLEVELYVSVGLDLRCVVMAGPPLGSPVSNIQGYPLAAMCSASVLGAGAYRAVSDSWHNSDAVLALSFKSLQLPGRAPPHTDLLDLDPLPVSALDNAAYQSMYRFTHFNAIQTQVGPTMDRKSTSAAESVPTARHTAEAPYTPHVLVQGASKAHWTCPEAQKQRAYC